MQKERKKYQNKRITGEVYKSESWLCPKTSPSTSSIVCYDGPVTFESGETHNRRFVEFKSCLETVRMFQYENDSTEDFLNKLKLLKRDLNKFIMYLEKKEGDNIVKKPRGRKKKEITK